MTVHKTTTKPMKSRSKSAAIPSLFIIAGLSTAMVVLLFNRWRRLRRGWRWWRWKGNSCIVNSSHILLRHYPEWIVKNLHDYIMDSYLLLLSYHTANQSVNPHNSLGQWAHTASSVSCCEHSRHRLTYPLDFADWMVWSGHSPCCFYYYSLLTTQQAVHLFSLTNVCSNRELGYHVCIEIKSLISWCLKKWNLSFSAALVSSASPLRWPCCVAVMLYQFLLLLIVCCTRSTSNSEILRRPL